MNINKFVWELVLAKWWYGLILSCLCYNMGIPENGVKCLTITSRAFSCDQQSLEVSFA